MHASTVAILAIAAATAPAFAKPIYARQDASGAFKISAGDIKDGIDIGNGIINAADSLKQVITGHTRRDVAELLTRAVEEELMARQAATDASGASIFSIAKDAFDVGKTVYDAVSGSNNNNNKREEELLARQQATDASGASIFSIAKDAFDVGKTVYDAVSGSSNNNNNKREEELFMRALEDELMARQDASGASIFSIAKDAFDVGKTVYDAVSGSNNNNNRREYEELVMRAVEDELMARQDASGAFKISTGDIKDGVDILNGVVNAADGLKQVITGHQKREPAFLGLGPVVNPHFRIGTVVGPRAVPVLAASASSALRPAPSAVKSSHFRPQDRIQRPGSVHRPHFHRPAAHTRPAARPTSASQPGVQRPQVTTQAAAHKRFSSLNELD
ncbi:hypothetical protein EUX98_g8290 [Antrodiella citrinella]|uniref:Uncharacterized protein n=1 Tax=Antrodiella citrinella TaxID=2447956 RepID=A0A4S4MB36_9APHY|nr:hypothetical protein EUX98_g8290 [Antrodiella citrinella]